MYPAHLAGLCGVPGRDVALGDPPPQFLHLVQRRPVQLVVQEEVHRLDLAALGLLDALGRADLGQGSQVTQLEAHQRGCALWAHAPAIAPQHLVRARLDVAPVAPRGAAAEPAVVPGA